MTPRTCWSMAVLVGLLSAAAGCTSRQFQRPNGPQASLELPKASPDQSRWPMTVPPGQQPVQQAGFTAAAPNAGAAEPKPPVRPELPPDLLAAQGLDRVVRIAELASQRAAALQSYYVRVRRREVVNGQALPEDLALLKFRSQPFSVYLKALEGSPTEGREIVFVNGKYNDMLQIRTGKSDIISGIRMELGPTSPRATANSRRTILDTGFANMVERFNRLVAEEQKSGSKLLEALGPQARPEILGSCECVKQTVPPGKEKHLPAGGERYWFFCTNPEAPEFGLPTLIFTLDESKREVEYYAHDRLVPNVALGEDEFDPSILWGR